MQKVPANFLDNHPYRERIFHRLNMANSFIDWMDNISFVLSQTTKGATIIVTAKKAQNARMMYFCDTQWINN